MVDHIFSKTIESTRNSVRSVRMVFQHEDDKKKVNNGNAKSVSSSIKSNNTLGPRIWSQYEDINIAKSVCEKVVHAHEDKVNNFRPSFNVATKNSARSEFAKG